MVTGVTRASRTAADSWLLFGLWLGRWRLSRYGISAAAQNGLPGAFVLLVWTVAAGGKPISINPASS